MLPRPAQNQNMTPNTEGQGEDFSADDMKGVVRRLEAIGWLDKEKNFVASGSVMVFYTPKGASLMPELIALSKSVGSWSSSPPFDLAKVNDALEFGKRLATLAPGLFLPPLSAGELKALKALMDDFGPSNDQGEGFKRVRSRS